MITSLWTLTHNFDPTRAGRRITLSSNMGSSVDQFGLGVLGVVGVEVEVGFVWLGIVAGVVGAVAVVGMGSSPGQTCGVGSVARAYLKWYGY